MHQSVKESNQLWGLMYITFSISHHKSYFNLLWCMFSIKWLMMSQTQPLIHYLTSVQISFPPSIDFSQYNNLSLKWYKVHQNQILYDIPHELMFKNETCINFQNISIGTVGTFFKIMFQHWTWASWSSIPKPMPIPTAHTHANSYTS